MARICVIRHGYYPLEPRIAKEVDALTRNGDEVVVICATKGDQPRFERSARLTVHRLPMDRRRGSPPRYLYQYAAFLVRSGLLAAKLHLHRAFDVVVVHSLPDPLVFAALVPRLMGARVLLDLQEAMPEFFAMKYRLSPRHPLVRAIGVVEQLSIRFADRAITCTDQMRDRFVERGADPKKMDVILISSNEEIFDPDRYPRPEPSVDRFVMIFHGTVEECFGVDTAVRALALLKDEIPGLQLRVFGDGTYRPTIESLARELGVADRVWLRGAFAPLPEVVAALAAADVGVVPTKHNVLRDLTHSTKMFDLVAMRKPAIVSRTIPVEAYFGTDTFELFRPGDEVDLARAIRSLYLDRERAHRLARRATEVAEPYRWARQRERYLQIIGGLVRGGERDDRSTIAMAQPDAVVVETGRNL